MGTFFNQPTGFTCEGCHRLEPELGHFGTDGHASFENEEQTVKIPHLRNLYQKVGKFGDLDVLGVTPLNTPFQGPQIRGFGYLHDGSRRHALPLPERERLPQRPDRWIRRRLPEQPAAA